MAGLDSNQVLASNQGLVRFVPNAVLDQMEMDRVLAERPQQQALDSLAQHIRDFFSSAKTAKLEIEQQMLSTLRQIKGEYEPDKLKAIQEMGGSTDFIRLTYHKCRDVEAWIHDILNPYADRTWSIAPDSLPDIPPEVLNNISQQVRTFYVQQATQQAQATGMPIDINAVMEQIKAHEDEVKRAVREKAQEVADERAANMERTIIDQLEQGGWEKAFKACINDLARVKSCILKGPIYRKEPSLSWQPDPVSGQFTAVVEDKVTVQFERVNPFDWYPAPNSIDVDDGDAIEVEHLTRRDLNKLIGVPGYKDDMIRAALNEHSKGLRESTPIDAERFSLEKENTTGYFDQKTQKIDLLNYWGSVQGKLLLEWGMTSEEVPDPDLDYQINAKMIGSYVIKAVLNPDPLGKKPYGVTSFIKNNDSQWGESPAEVMSDLQGICNAAVRALVNNMAISSGPLTEIDIDRLASGESADIWPHKVIQTTNKRMVEGPAVRFYQAQLLATDLLRIYDQFKREADDLVVPAYGHGAADVGGAGNTSSGLAMLMSAATRNVKLAITNVDGDLIVRAIQAMFNHNMRFLDDESIKGTLHVKARGVNSHMVKEQMAVRRKEFLAETLNPMDEQIMGVKGRAYVLAENVKALEMDPKRALPNLEQIERMPMMMPGMMPGMAPNPGQQAAPQQLDNAGNPQGGEASNLNQQGAA